MLSVATINSSGTIFEGCHILAIHGTTNIIIGKTDNFQKIFSFFNEFRTYKQESEIVAIEWSGASSRLNEWATFSSSLFCMRTNSLWTEHNVMNYCFCVIYYRLQSNKICKRASYKMAHCKDQSGKKLREFGFVLAGPRNNAAVDKNGNWLLQVSVFRM